MPLSIRPDAGSAGAPSPKSVLASFREAPQAVVDHFFGTFVRDVVGFFPACRFECEPAPSLGSSPLPEAKALGSGFRLGFQLAEESDPLGQMLRTRLFGVWYQLRRRDGLRFSPQDRRLIRSIGGVLELRCHFALQWAQTSRLELNRGVPEDHYIAASVDPSSYVIVSARPSRVAAAILTLRTMALSTYENRRISTGALLLGAGANLMHPGRYPLGEALRFGVELTSLKSLQRLCDGRRSVFLVDRDGNLVDIVDIAHWAKLGEISKVLSRGTDRAEDDKALPNPPIPCARAYTPHALATRSGGHVCLVLSPNQEIMVFAGGQQEFAFAHGRWRVLDPAAKFAFWEEIVADSRLARVLFQTALDLAEGRQGGMLVVVADPAGATDRLIASSDLLESSNSEPDAEIGGGPVADAIGNGFGAVLGAGFGDPPTKRSLHYLVRGCSATSLDPPVLEALAALDGALVTDSSGRLLAFGAILRHDASSLDSSGHSPGSTAIEGARTTAAMAASRFGPVLKISEDGIVSCFHNGVRVWDL